MSDQNPIEFGKKRIHTEVFYLQFAFLRLFSMSPQANRSNGLRILELDQNFLVAFDRLAEFEVVFGHRLDSCAEM